MLPPEQLPRWAVPPWRLALFLCIAPVKPNGILPSTLQDSLLLTLSALVTRALDWDSRDQVSSSGSATNSLCVLGTKFPKGFRHLRMQIGTPLDFQESPRRLGA